MRKIAIFILLALSITTQAQYQSNPGSNHGNKFEELGFLLPTPNEYRTATGAPGPRYWQQRCDYDMNIDLDEVNNIITGSETVTYYNNSPNTLSYLWLQIDENFHNPQADNNWTGTGKMQSRMTDQQLNQLEPWRRLEGYGVNIIKLTDATDKALKFTIVKTMMRVDLPVDLKPGQKYVFKVSWNYRIPDKLTRYGRGGYESFADGNNLYSIAQFYPRLCVYSDFQGWQTLQFTGGAEFATTFGNFKMRLTVPADHIVASTGECKNYQQVLTAEQVKRWQQAQTTKEPLFMVTLEEALAASKNKTTEKKTWIFEAENVRDVAFNSSRRLVWDAMPITVEGKKIMCMSFYGKEAYPIYSRYSTKATAHTLKVYSKYTIPYPYPVAQSVEAAIGMEYPMLAMNPGRAADDGTYTESAKYSCIGVTIHEVGHNFFPMIINSDERQWWWMDEGLNTFTQFLTEQEFDINYPSTRGPAHLITNYMRLPKDQLEPIMTKGDAVANVGANAYAKTATGLNILRETILGRELFDFGFKEYAKRWAFKHPTAADLFRTMEDASGTDLDWFWRGWFFTTDPVDISLDSVKWYRMADPNATASTGTAPAFENISKMRNKQDKNLQFYVDSDTLLRDFYYYNRGADAAYATQQATAGQQKADQASFDNVSAAKWKDKHFYELTFSNKGGLVMPVIVEWTFKDGTKQVDKLPVTIWRANEKNFSKIFVKDQEVVAVKLDPMRETADIDEANGMWPIKEMPNKFHLFKQASTGFTGPGAGRVSGNDGNSMQRAREQKKN